MKVLTGLGLLGLAVTSAILPSGWLMAGSRAAQAPDGPPAVPAMPPEAITRSACVEAAFASNLSPLERAYLDASAPEGC